MNEQICMLMTQKQQQCSKGEKSLLVHLPQNRKQIGLTLTLNVLYTGGLTLTLNVLYTGWDKSPRDCGEAEPA